ncbi:helix-turn-helix transcriptional regulator [Anaerovorax sp. IOR16]|uniref:helix-turn-helix transcriptional regulator n=1 Tax=Anaerovorax sp. IOR16 TaxID=2773458 RepID=UPI002ECFD60C
MSRLRELREQLGLKQDELALVIGTSLPNYSKKENGEIRVSLIEAKQIADFFNMPIEDIFFAVEVSKSDTL